MPELYCPRCQFSAVLPEPVTIWATTADGPEGFEFSADTEAMMREPCPECGKVGLDVRGDDGQAND